MNKNIKKNKKGVMLSQEAFLVIVVLLLVGLVVFFSLKYVKVSAKDFELTPEITYQYPTIYIKSFLNKEITLTENEKTETGLQKNKYKIKELLIYDNDEIKNLIKIYKKEFQKINKDSLEKYNVFSNEKLNSENLLRIERKKKEIPNLAQEIKNKNYFFYLKDRKNEFIIIYFKKAKQMINSNEIDELHNIGGI